MQTEHMHVHDVQTQPPSRHALKTGLKVP
uniref:Uncharacterized protein n=1 Tax=Anguilla anguilla TaxID=7936 RepID=A0A0E9XSL8_ANGAN